MNERANPGATTPPTAGHRRSGESCAALDVAAGLWLRCNGCGRLIYSSDLEENLWVCPRCENHFPLEVGERLEVFLDAGSFVPDPGRLLPLDPLGFSDSRGYGERLNDAKAKTGLVEAVVWGRASIGGIRVVVAAMEFGFMGGSMGSVVGESVARAARAAGEQRVPLVIFCTSGGARMQEGMYSLMQMAKTASEIGRLSESGVPYVSVLANPTTGGVAASFATMADVILAEKRALIGFAGPRVIEQTTGRRLPRGLQSAEFCLEHGLVDCVGNRLELREMLASILRMLSGERTGGAGPGSEGEARAEAIPGTGRNRGLSSWEAVQLARHGARPRFKYYVEEIFEDFIELHGDRLYGDDAAILGGLARLDGMPVMLLGHNKGRGCGHPTEPAANNGMPCPEGIRKALRLARLAEKIGLPVVTLIDTPGAYPGIGAEERGQAHAISSILGGLAALETPILSVVIGEGGSGGALSLGIADVLLMMEKATFSVISPEGCAAILWRDSAYAREAARALKLTAPELLEMGLIDGIVPEPPGGAHADPRAAAEILAGALRDNLRELAGRPRRRLVAERYGKYASMGVYDEFGESR